MHSHHLVQVGLELTTQSWLISYLQSSSCLHLPSAGLWTYSTRITFSFAFCEQFIKTSSTGKKNINSICVYSLMRFVKTLMDPKPEHGQRSGRRHFAPALPPAAPSHHACCEYSCYIVACRVLNFTQVRPDSIVSLWSWDSFAVLHVIDEHSCTASQCMNTVYPVVCL